MGRTAHTQKLAPGAPLLGMWKGDLKVLSVPAATFEEVERHRSSQRNRQIQSQLCHSLTRTLGHIILPPISFCRKGENGSCFCSLSISGWGILRKGYTN